MNDFFLREEWILKHKFIPNPSGPESLAVEASLRSMNDHQHFFLWS